MFTQTILQQKNWQSEPTENLVTSNPVKEGLELDNFQTNRTKSKSPRYHKETPQRSVNSWKQIEGLSWLFLEDVEEY
ncbi:MAG: hypothetical protein KC444_07105 [Nitrosopumilus sp.]|nr:hypothetical protein [Nitrosopumilus sp.]